MLSARTIYGEIFNNDEAFRRNALGGPVPAQPSHA
jgi:hypothetical protein